MNSFILIIVLCMIISTLSLKSSSSSLYRRIKTSLKSNDKVEVKEYFDNEGFNRWNKIYSDSDEVNKVQLGNNNNIHTTLLINYYYHYHYYIL